MHHKKRFKLFVYSLLTHQSLVSKAKIREVIKKVAGNRGIKQIQNARLALTTRKNYSRKQNQFIDWLLPRGECKETFSEHQFYKVRVSQSRA